MSETGMYWEGIKILRCHQCWHLFTEDYTQRSNDFPESEVSLPDKEWQKRYAEEQALKEAESKTEDWTLPWERNKEEIKVEVPIQ
jgi:hypothetical protein